MSTTWDRLLRQLNESIDRTILGDRPMGIISAVPVPREPPPPVTAADIDRTLRQLYEAGLPRQPRLEFRYGEGVPEQLTASVEMRPMRPGEPNRDAIWGMPMVPDESLRPGEWRIVDDRGVVRSFNNPDLGIAVVLPTDAVWTMPPPARVDRPGSPGAGGLLDRIDAMVEAWECGPDAYRYTPNDTPERGDLTG